MVIPRGGEPVGCFHHHDEAVYGGSKGGGGGGEAELGTSSRVDVVVVVAADVAWYVKGDCTCTGHPAPRDSLLKAAPRRSRSYFQKGMSGLIWVEVDGGVVKEVADPGSKELRDRQETPRAVEVHDAPWIPLLDGRDPFPTEGSADVVAGADSAWFPSAASSGLAALLP